MFHLRICNVINRHLTKYKYVIALNPKYVSQTLLHVDNHSVSEESNSVFVKDNVLQLMQKIFIITVPVIKQVVVFSFIHICFSGIIGATIKMESD